ncbi:P-loop containing nucleoside triphosphate hydrolase protein [Chytriomyces sp. MP71]|nr:P-loop containing nucleoside triphosphate hydrolase protein [Chytriomyces sp. MP71]
MTNLIVVMGVAGCGKSTIGANLAEHLNSLSPNGAVFIEGDDLHSDGNRAKMASGVALTDLDREPWLAALVDKAASEAKTGREHVVLSCSALKRRYRDQLRTAAQPQKDRMRFVYARVPVSTLSARLSTRKGHFMGASMLQSQLDAFDEPVPAEEPDVVVVDNGNGELDIALIAQLVVKERE